MQAYARNQDDRSDHGRHDDTGYHDLYEIHKSLDWSDLWKVGVKWLHDKFINDDYDWGDFLKTHEKIIYDFVEYVHDDKADRDHGDTARPPAAPGPDDDHHQKDHVDKAYWVGSPWNDKIYGSKGDDHIYGGKGDDYLYGDGGDHHGATAYAASHATADHARDDQAAWGSGKHRDHTDQRKHGGDDYLYGENGDDHLYGGPGKDHLYGGKGHDHFYFDEYTEYDIIHDYQKGDKIYVPKQVEPHYERESDHVKMTYAYADTEHTVEIWGDGGGDAHIDWDYIA